MSATREQIVNCARSYVGVRFKHEGRTREEGLDCFGLIIRVAWDLHLSQFTLTGYGHYPHAPSVRKHCDAQMTRKPLVKMQPGDILRFANKHWDCHLACVGDGGRPFSLIHSLAEQRRVVESPLSDDLRSHIRACYQLPNVTEVTA
jgi:hypothetical protein